jgi:hypothetical protein
MCSPSFFKAQAHADATSPFVDTLHIISLTLNLGDSVMSSSGSANLLVVGQWVIAAGLCGQLLFFGAFVITFMLFHIRIARSATQEWENSMVRRGLLPSDWRARLLALYLASVLILVRSVYRVIEFVQGNDGYVISHEVFLYLFDAAMILLVMIVLNIVHPPFVLREKEKVSSEEPKSSFMSWSCESKHKGGIPFVE